MMPQAEKRALFGASLQRTDPHTYAAELVANRGYDGAKTEARKAYHPSNHGGEYEREVLLEVLRLEAESIRRGDRKERVGL